MRKNSVILSCDDNDNIAVIILKGRTVEEVEAKVSEALEEEFSVAVTKIDFDWEDFDNQYSSQTMEVNFEEYESRDITVSETWIY